MVNIFTSLPSGVYLQLYDYMGFVTDRILVPPGISAIDGSFWSAWVAANPTSALLTNHILLPAG